MKIHNIGLDDGCPFCDSMNYSQKDFNKSFCRDCGEEWVEDENENLTVSTPGTARSDEAN